MSKIPATYESVREMYSHIALDEIERLRGYGKWLIDHPEEGKRLLVDAGILNQDGSFTDPYKSLEEFKNVDSTIRGSDSQCPDISDGIQK